MGNYVHIFSSWKKKRDRKKVQQHLHLFVWHLKMLKNKPFSKCRHTFIKFC